MYLKRLPRWARMEAEHSKGHHFPIVASPINISTPVPSSLYVTQRYPYMIAQNQVSSYNPFHLMTMVMKCQIWWIADEIWWNMKSVQRKWFSSQIFYFRSLFSARAGRGLGAGEVFCPGTNEQWCRDIGQDWLSLLHQWKLNHGLVQSSFRGTE